MTKTVFVRESYDWVTEADVTQAQYEELIRYIEEKYPNENVLDLKYKRLRFINYVGVIQCSDVRYEIRPKINLSPNDERKALLSMLSITRFLPISFFDKVQNGEGTGDLLSAIVAAFLDRLLIELKRGIYKTYERQEENLYVMKGKLELTKHIRQNAFQKTRAYCSFDEHTENNELNQLFKATLHIVRKYTDLASSSLQLERCLRHLENVDLVSVSDLKLDNIILNRQNERFRDAVLFAKIIIERASIYNQGQQSSSFSFLFPMNLLFERYVEVALQEAVGYDQVISQHAEMRLLHNKKTGRDNVLLKPDFVINNNLIIDTKWKSATYHGKTRYQQSDIYQMYAYVTAYKNANRCILLYPKQEDEADLPVWEVVDTDKIIEMRAVRIDDYWGTVDELRVMIGD